MSSSRRRFVFAAVALAALAAALAPVALRGLLWRWETNPVLRGRLVAERSGCYSCHRPHAAVEIPNPGSRWGTVPRFGAGNAFMYAPSRAEIEELIRKGSRTTEAGEQRILMPGYEGRLSDAEISDLVAWTAAAEGVERAGGDAVKAGREIAGAQGCISCHGLEGSGGLPNPGSLGGFIPGFAGRNFPDLVESRAEFDEWVLDGTSSRLEANPVVRYFWRRQRIVMPSYRGTLDAEELEALWLWVEALRTPERAP